jgi:hypothetical protein
MSDLYRDFKKILDKEKLAYIATYNGTFVDNSVVCYSVDSELNLYFGSYSDTLKCRNFDVNPFVAIALSTLQIHGIARLIGYDSEEYNEKIKIYIEKFPQYAHVFNKENNELYEVKPLVMWNYNPSKGEMHRDNIIFDNDYFKKINAYEPPTKFEYR